jgi:hypothetical protein
VRGQGDSGGLVIERADAVGGVAGGVLAGELAAGLLPVEVGADDDGADLREVGVVDADAAQAAGGDAGPRLVSGGLVQGQAGLDALAEQEDAAGEVPSPRRQDAPSRTPTAALRTGGWSW